MKTKRNFLIVVSANCDVKDYGKNWVSVWGIAHGMQYVKTLK